MLIEASAVIMLLVEKFLSKRSWSKNYRRHDTSSTCISSKNFCRHGTSSTQHFVEKHFVDRTLRRKTFRRQDILSKNISSTGHFVEKHFVDTTLRRQSISSINSDRNLLFVESIFLAMESTPNVKVR